MILPFKRQDIGIQKLFILNRSCMPYWMIAKLAHAYALQASSRADLLMHRVSAQDQPFQGQEDFAGPTKPYNPKMKQRYGMTTKTQDTGKLHAVRYIVRRAEYRKWPLILMLLATWGCKRDCSRRVYLIWSKHADVMKKHVCKGCKAHDVRRTEVTPMWLSSMLVAAFLIQ